MSDHTDRQFSADIAAAIRDYRRELARPTLPFATHRPSFDAGLFCDFMRHVRMIGGDRAFSMPRKPKKNERATFAQARARLMAPPSYFESKDYRFRAFGLHDYSQFWAHEPGREFIAWFRALLRMSREWGIPLVMTKASVSYGEQEARFRAGETFVPAGASPHQFGAALHVEHAIFGNDLTHREWLIVGEMGREAARATGRPVSWGGSNFPHHFEVRDWPEKLGVMRPDAFVAADALPQRSAHYTRAMAREWRRAHWREDAVSEHDGLLQQAGFGPARIASLCGGKGGVGRERAVGGAPEFPVSPSWRERFEAEPIPGFGGCSPACVQCVFEHVFAAYQADADAADLAIPDWVFDLIGGRIAAVRVRLKREHEARRSAEFVEWVRENPWLDGPCEG